MEQISYYYTEVCFEKLGNKLTIAGRESAGWSVKITSTDVASFRINIRRSPYVDFISGNKMLSLGLAFLSSVATLSCAFPGCQHPLLHKQTHKCLLDIFAEDQLLSFVVLCQVDYRVLELLALFFCNHV